jgi:hypothetical protein
MFAGTHTVHTVQVVGRPQARASTNTRNSAVVYSFIGDCQMQRCFPGRQLCTKHFDPSEVMSTSSVLLLCPEPGIFIFPALSLLDAASLLVARRSGAHIPSCDQMLLLPVPFLTPVIRVIPLCNILPSPMAHRCGQA